MNMTYDTEAGAAYMKIRKGSVHVTRKVTESLLVDMDKKRNVLGVEFLFISVS